MTSTYTVRDDQLRCLSSGHSSVLAAEEHLDREALAVALHPDYAPAEILQLLITIDERADQDGDQSAPGPVVAVHRWHTEPRT